MPYNKYSFTVPTLARFTRSEVAQRTLLDTHPEAAANLAANPHLDRDLWFRLARKAKADVAYALVDRPLDLEQLRLFATDKRITVRRTLVSSGLKACTEEMGRFLLDQPWFDAEIATLWCNARSVPDSLKKDVALVAGGSVLVRLLADRTRFETEEAAALLTTVNLTYARQALYQLLDRRPELVDAALGAGVEHPRLVEAAAGSRHLFGAENFATVLHTVELLGGQNHHGNDILVTALSNPNTPLEILEQLTARFPRRLLGVGSRFRPATHAQVLDDASRRLASAEPAAQGPWEDHGADDQRVLRRAVALLGTFRYPTLKDLIVPTVAVPAPAPTARMSEEPEQPDLRHLPNSSSPVRLTAVTVQHVSDLLDEHGTRAWETFWSLIDSWQGDLASLVDTSVSLAA